MLELEEQAVAAGGGELDLEVGAVAARVDVQERHVALAERDEVAAGAEVGLGRDRLAVARDGEVQLRSGLVEPDVVAAVAHRGGLRGGERLEVGAAVDPQVAGEGLRRVLVGEVGEQPVRAGLVEADRGRPGAVGALGRVQVLEAGEVAAGEDQVHALRRARRRSRGPSARACRRCGSAAARCGRGAARAARRRRAGRRPRRRGRGRSGRGRRRGARSCDHSVRRPGPWGRRRGA